MLPLGDRLGTGRRRTQAPIAIVVIGGQMLSLIVTLLVTPVAHLVLDRLFSRNKAAATPPQDSATASRDIVPETRS